MSEKTVIIGGVAGGATAAARLRRRDSRREIIILERGEYISYANCGLPYHIGGVIKERENLLLQTPQAMKKKFDIDVRTSNEVTRILPEEKKLIVRNNKTGEFYEEAYDNLVIATGSSPIKPPIPGIDGGRIHTLWTVPDTDNIKEAIKVQKPKTAAVIGGGFIGLEMAENLSEAGIRVSLVEMQNQVMAPLDYEMAQLIHENMDSNGVELVLGDGVQEFINEETHTTIRLASGRHLEAELVILAIGVKPNGELAREAGLSMNERGGVRVDGYLRTSDPSIYAVGDVIEVDNFITKEKTMIPLAGPANKQGRICADNLAGDRKPYEGSMGTAVAKVFDLTAASVGLNEKNLRAMGKRKDIDYHTLLINQKSHAGYYPGAALLTLKLLFSPKGAILGAQIVGQEGADKRIDTIAVTMRLNGTVRDLAKLELAYAPPYSAAKDPVNMAGFVAENILDDLVSFVEYDQVDELLKDAQNPGEGSVTSEVSRGGAVCRDRRIHSEETEILDVTEDVERMVFSLPGSCHIPLGQLRERLQELDREKTIITYCAIGVRSYNAARILAEHGFSNVKVLSGGTSFYKSMHWQSMGRMIRAEKEITQEIEGGSVMAASVGQEIQILNCSGLQCPGPIMKVNQALEKMQDGQVLQVSATDMGFARDVDAWCRRTGNTMVKTERREKEHIVFIQKGLAAPGSVGNVAESNDKNRTVCAKMSGGTGVRVEDLPQGKTIIVFSGDLDKVLASFIIANGAAAMGRPVTMFFTFWGLNALRKSQKKKVKKPFLDAMFGAMMPRGSKKLKLSKMNMGGMGTKMMKKVMNDKNVNSLEELMISAMDQGVKLVACTMSMDIMGITKEELLDGVEYAGVASYLGDAEESNVNLFI